MPLSLTILRVLEENERNYESESIEITYWSSFPHRSRSLSPWGTSSLSSEHNPPSRAITDSILFFTNGDLCSSVSLYHDELTALRYLVEFQEHTER